MWLNSWTFLLFNKENWLTNRNFGEDPQVFCASKKYKREKVEKKLPNEYEPLSIPKDYNPSTGIFSFNMHILGR